MSPLSLLTPMPFMVPKVHAVPIVSIVPKFPIVPIDPKAPVVLTVPKVPIVSIIPIVPMILSVPTAPQCLPAPPSPAPSPINPSGGPHGRGGTTSRAPLCALPLYDTRAGVRVEHFLSPQIRAPLTSGCLTPLPQVTSGSGAAEFRFRRGALVTASAMGAHLARRYAGGADTEPDPLAMPTFPADLGLPGREPRSKGWAGPRGGPCGAWGVSVGPGLGCMDLRGPYGVWGGGVWGLRGLCRIGEGLCGARGSP